MIRDDRLHRIDANRLRVTNDHGIDAVLFANDDVPVESAAVTELLEMLELQQTIERTAEAVPDAFDLPPTITQVAVTPDFHKARGIPVGTVLATEGFVVPQAIGNDINCGMRLHLTSLTSDRINARLDDLDTALRQLYFEAGRNIPMSRVQRDALFRRGLTGLFDATPKTMKDGLWSLIQQLDVEHDLARVDRRGSLPAGSTIGLSDFMGPTEGLTRDSQIGSIGGGNHFVELQRIENILDAKTAHAWGIKPGMVTVMVHSGSVSIGHLSGGIARDEVRALHPKTLKHPGNGIFPLPEGERYRQQWGRIWDSLHNAANFAFANRMFLAMMAWEGLRRVHGDISFSLLYDAPHNFLWKETIDGKEINIHRKGACPARGYGAMAGTPFEYFGEPVLVPGSMGASSFILAGNGCDQSLWSASHGAGRTLSRGKALKGFDDEFQDFLARFRVVTPVNLRRQDIRQRPDILEKKLEELRQEAPYAYKGIGPIINTLTDANIARPVAELVPIMTVKG